MKKYLILLTLILNVGLLYPHCQVPCGIYDDAVRIVTVKEDFATSQNINTWKISCHQIL